MALLNDAKRAMQSVRCVARLFDLLWVQTLWRTIEWFNPHRFFLFLTIP